MKNTKIIVIANKIRSIYNVGSIFRTCDAVGVEKLYLAGYTATPKVNPIQIAKTALGAEQSVDWEKIKTVAPTIKKLKKDGYEIIGLEYKEGSSTSFEKWAPKKKVCLIVGNEVKGLSPNILKQCDKTVHLPMLGKKSSLNVSVAFGAIVYYVLTKFRK